MKKLCLLLTLGLAAMTVRATTYYVDASQPDDSGDGLSWVMAKKSIQAAIDISDATEIVVTNGTYAPIVTANKAVTIRSVNGAEETFIEANWMNRCATLGTVEGHTHTVLIGFTLRYGDASNNVILGQGFGGGVLFGTLNHCVISDNRTERGGGAYESVLNNCLLIGNTAYSFGGGAAGGVLNNCTIAGNRASQGAGGVYGPAKLNNCIVWGNLNDDNHDDTATFNYSCTKPMPNGGIGNIVTDPLFVNIPNSFVDFVNGNYRLRPGSPCIDAGDNSLVVGIVDLDGNPRVRNGGIGTGLAVDMGAYEFWPEMAVIASPATGGAVEGGGRLFEAGEEMDISATPNTGWRFIAWDDEDDDKTNTVRTVVVTLEKAAYTAFFEANTYTIVYDGNGATSGSMASTIHTYDTPAPLALNKFFNTGFYFAGWTNETGNVYANGEVVSNLTEEHEGTNTLYAVWEAVRPNETWYVDDENGDDNNNGFSWETAKQTIQAAIDLSVDGNTILVTNGTYAAITTDNKAVTIQSVNGYADTFIDGGNTNRCATLGWDTVLTGFTLCNGNATNENVTVANGFGGGALFGTLNQCELVENTADNGGGAHGSVLNNCLITHNTANENGGGADNCALYNCTVSQNTAEDGGGVYASTNYNSIVWGNYLWDETDENNNHGGDSVFFNSCTTPIPEDDEDGNMDDDPLFLGALFMLSPESPCIDAGDNDFAPGDTDIRGDDRIQNETVDMGAFEFSPVLYNVEFDGNGGEPEFQYLEQSLGQYYVLPPAPALKGYRFTGWFTGETNGMQITTTNRVVETEAHTLWAHWEIRKYTVTLNRQGGTGGTGSVTATWGEPLPENVDAPTRDGYDFDGFYQNTDGGGKQYYKPDMTTDDMEWDQDPASGTATIYANWIAKTYTVTLNRQGGTGGTGSVTATFDQFLPTAGVTAPTRAGYDFGGYYASTNSASQYYTAAMGAGASRWTTPGNGTIYARWIAKKYPVMFNAVDGAPEFQETTQTVGAGYVMPPETPVRGNDVFLGWFTMSENGGEPVTTNTVVPVVNPLSIYAQWAPPKQYVAVTFNGNGGTPALQNTAQTVSEKYVLPAEPTRTGYFFLGWFTGQNSGNEVTGATTVTTASPHTLWARWSANPYTVTFDADGGTLVPGSESKIVGFGFAYGELPTPEMDDWWFAGWYTSTNGMGNRVKKTTVYNYEHDTTLYAYWVDDPKKAQDSFLADPENLPKNTAETAVYSGFVYDDDFMVRGTMTLTAKKTVNKKTGATAWTGTSKVLLQHATVSFSGKPASADNFILNGRTNEKLELALEADTFFGEVSGGKIGGTYYVAGSRNIFADKAAQAELAAVRGLYNIALTKWWELPAPVPMIGEPDASAFGWLTLNVGNLGNVRIAGKLADGTAVSQSAKLLAGLNLDGWYCVALHRPLYTKKGFIGGLLWINRNNPRAVLVDTESGWFVNWQDKETNLNKMDAAGGWFGNGSAGPRLPQDLKFYAVVPDDLPTPVLNYTDGKWMDGVYPWDLSVKVDGSKMSMPSGVTPKKGATEYDYTKANPSLLKLTYTERTGAFKGSFKLYYDGSDMRKSQHKIITVSYSGLMVPLEGVLTGFGAGTATINRQKIPIPVFLAE